MKEYKIINKRSVFLLILMILFYFNLNAFAVKTDSIATTRDSRSVNTEPILRSGNDIKAVKTDSIATARDSRSVNTEPILRSGNDIKAVKTDSIATARDSRSVNTEPILRSGNDIKAVKTDSIARNNELRSSVNINRSQRLISTSSHAMSKSSSNNSFAQNFQNRSRLKKRPSSQQQVNNSFNRLRKNESLNNRQTQNFKSSRRGSGNVTVKSSTLINRGNSVNNTAVNSSKVNSGINLAE